MESMTRQINSRGALTIAKIQRSEAGFLPGVLVDIEAKPGEVIIRKHMPSCCLCGSTDGVIQLDGREFCRGCIERMGEAVKAND